MKRNPLAAMPFAQAVFLGVAILLPAFTTQAADDSALLDIEWKVTHGYATNDTVRIHYATLGQGPLVVMIHGFPDCWLTWRVQMEALAKDHEVVAIDQRGYNLSDRPKGVENYDMKLLVSDVAAVIRARGRERAIVVPRLGRNCGVDFRDDPTGND